MLTKKEELKSSSLLDQKGQKAACQRKSTTDKKDRIAYSKLRVTMQKGEMKSVTMMIMGEN
jgi:hypothetical protein